jgi:Tfp pilus assembly PilM family ATPase
MSDAVSYFTREFYKGGDDLTDAVSKKLSIDLKEAEALKRSVTGAAVPAGGGGDTSRRSGSTTSVPIVLLEKGDSGKYGAPPDVGGSGGGGGDADRVMDCITGPLEDICHDINISIDYFENQYDRKVEEVYITGGASNTLGLQEILERTVQKPVNRWNPLQFMEQELDKDAAQELSDYAAQAAIGLGLGARVTG